MEELNNLTQEEYLTVLAAAKYLKVSRDKIHYLLSTHKLEAVIDPLDNRRKLIRRISLDALRQPGRVITPDQL